MVIGAKDHFEIAELPISNIHDTTLASKVMIEAPESEAIVEAFEVEERHFAAALSQSASLNLSSSTLHGNHGRRRPHRLLPNLRGLDSQPHRVLSPGFHGDTLKTFLYAVKGYHGDTTAEI
ncbi:hypothetical protein Nepgr_003700 [Nepenthes gracilis]|uniref:Uncharacterized protein n=1 Tax=Nepenthes gracilis TaxID=150966 RepID=A0AAD3XEB1_NEPGR|nr:hypothetical protein Nepgr_003700 [Nepenthes gracilis]